MAQGIYVPKRQQNDQLGKLLPLVGAGIGAVGGPAGMSAGMAAGGMAGGLIAQPQPQGPAPVESSAMNMRQQQLDQEPLRQIRESLAALKTLPPEQQALYAPSLMQADQMARIKA